MWKEKVHCNWMQSLFHRVGIRINSWCWQDKRIWGYYCYPQVHAVLGTTLKHECTGNLGSLDLRRDKEFAQKPEKQSQSFACTRVKKCQIQPPCYMPQQPCLCHSSTGTPPLAKYEGTWGLPGPRETSSGCTDTTLLSSEAFLKHHRHCEGAASARLGQDRGSSTSRWPVGLSLVLGTNCLLLLEAKLFRKSEYTMAALWGIHRGPLGITVLQMINEGKWGVWRRQLSLTTYASVLPCSRVEFQRALTKLETRLEQILKYYFPTSSLKKMPENLTAQGEDFCS